MNYVSAAAHLQRYDPCELDERCDRSCTGFLDCACTGTHHQDVSVKVPLVLKSFTSQACRHNEVPTYHDTPCIYIIITSISSEY